MISLITVYYHNMLQRTDGSHIIIFHYHTATIVDKGRRETTISCDWRHDNTPTISGHRDPSACHIIVGNHTSSFYLFFPATHIIYNNNIIVIIIIFFRIPPGVRALGKWLGGGEVGTTVDIRITTTARPPSV